MNIVSGVLICMLEILLFKAQRPLLHLAVERGYGEYSYYVGPMLFLALLTVLLCMIAQEILRAFYRKHRHPYAL